MYERYKICPKLGPKEKCFRVQQFRNGEVIELFHQHVPAHRISLNAEINALEALLGHFAGWNGIYILHSRLNNRGSEPAQFPRVIAHVAYPEEGVIRRYFSSGDTTAWSDNVISRGEFRRDKS